MAVLVYDPSSVSIVFAGTIITGYDDGTFVSIERNNDMWAIKVGADGIGTRAKSSDKSGRVTITLMASSPANDKLSAMAVADELSGAGVAPLLVRDGSGRTVASALSAWVVKMPQVEFSKEPSNRAWTLETDSLTLYVGGS